METFFFFLVPTTLNILIKRIYNILCEILKLLLENKNLFCLLNSLYTQKLDIFGSKNYEILKSDFNKETNHYEFEMRHEGPWIEGIYNYMDRLNYTLFSADIFAKYDFKIVMFPTILKMEWDFGINETTKKLTLKDFKASLDPVDIKGMTLYHIFGNYDVEFKPIVDRVLPHLKKAVDIGFEVLTDLPYGFLEVMFDQYESVEELAEYLSTDLKPRSRLDKLFRCFKEKPLPWG